MKSSETSRTWNPMTSGPPLPTPRAKRITSSRKSPDNALNRVNASSNCAGRLARIVDRLQILLEPPVLRVPAVRRHRLKALGRKRSVDDRARLGQRRDGAGGKHLHGDVAERGRFDRAGEHGATGRIGSELVQQPVARTAADDPDLVEAAAGQPLERLEDDTIFE